MGLPSQRMPRAAISVSVRGTVLSRLTWGRFDLQAHSHGFQQNGVPQSLLRRGYLILCHMSVPCLATQLLTTYFIKVSKQQEPQKECKQERSHCLLHLILLYSLFIRGKSVDPAHPSGCEHQEAGIPGGHFWCCRHLDQIPLLHPLRDQCYSLCRTSVMDWSTK